MTKREAIVISAYTGVLMCDFADMHAYVQEVLGYPVFTHQFGSEYMADVIRNATREDFLQICNSVTEEKAKSVFLFKIGTLLKSAEVDKVKIKLEEEIKAGLVLLDTWMTFIGRENLVDGEEVEVIIKQKEKEGE